MAYTISTALTKAEQARLRKIKKLRSLSISLEVTKLIRAHILAPEAGQAKELREALEAQA